MNMPQNNSWVLDRSLRWFLLAASVAWAACDTPAATPYGETEQAICMDPPCGPSREPPPCSPTCAGKTCGADDGCGTPCFAGSCPAGQTCGGGGVPAQCACPPDCAGKACGAPDGCGGICTAGSCPTGQYCGAHGAVGQCGVASFGQGVECFVFDDGYTNRAGPSGAITFQGPRRACVPGAGSAICRKWFGRCRTTDASHEPVSFRGFEYQPANVTAAADAVYMNDSYQMCIPDGTPTGTCRTWFGEGALATGRSVMCRLFDDGTTRLTALTAGIAMLGAPFGLGNGNHVCMLEGSYIGFLGVNGTSRKWFGECSVTGCGDGLCTGTESPSTCPSDCGCGDGVCSRPEESVYTCPGECPALCGDAICSRPGENVSNCPGDCAVLCGDAICSPGETNATCPGDCPLPKTCSGADAGSAATNYAIGLKNGWECAVGIVAFFANSQSEAEGCALAAYPWYRTVTDPAPVQDTFHTDPTYGCAELDVWGFSAADAETCAANQGYSYAGPCP